MFRNIIASGVFFGIFAGGCSGAKSPEPSDVSDSDLLDSDGEPLGPAQHFEPGDELVVVQAEREGKAFRSLTGFTEASDKKAATYLVVRSLGAPPAPNEAPPRYVAVFGPADALRRVELEKVVQYDDDRHTLFAAPKNELPPPCPMQPLPSVAEGDSLTFVSAKVRNDYGTTSFERVRVHVKVTKILSDPSGLPVGFQTSPVNDAGLLLDDKNRIVALASPSGFEGARSLDTNFLRKYLVTQLQAMRMLVSRTGDDEITVEFVALTCDPFGSGLKPTLMVAHPTKEQGRLPDHERLHGRNIFRVVDGVWTKPAEGTQVDLAPVNEVPPVFDLPPVSDARLKPAIWKGVYRFKPSQMQQPLWHQAALLNDKGLIERPLGSDSHVKFTHDQPKPVLFKHPVSQYEQGTPAAPSGG